MCDCVSCSATHAAKEWPRSTDVQQFKVNALDRFPPEHYPPEKLARMDRVYRAHAAHALRGGIQRLIPETLAARNGAAFYGVPAGSTRAQVEEVAAQEFRGTEDAARIVRDGEQIPTNERSSSMKLTIAQKQQLSTLIVTAKRGIEDREEFMRNSPAHYTADDRRDLRRVKQATDRATKTLMNGFADRLEKMHDALAIIASDQSACSCVELSWIGRGHDTACPISRARYGLGRAK